MCNPVALGVIAVAMTAATTAVQYVGQKDAAKSENAFRNQQLKQTTLNANRALAEDSARANLRIRQESEKASQDIFETNKRRAEAQSTSAVSSGEAGVTGLSVAALMGDFERAAAVRNEGTRRNLGFVVEQVEADKRAMRIQAANRILGARYNPKAGPSATAALLKVGQAAVSTYGGLQEGGHLGSGADTVSTGELPPGPNNAFPGVDPNFAPF